MSPSKKACSSAVPRPAPLKVHRYSHLIHKPLAASSSSSFSSSSSPSDSDASNGNNNNNNQQQQQRQPVIIYTHSPKIIHTQARDFMALVQKLTGLSRSEDDDGGPAAPQPAQPQHAGARSRSDGKAAVPRTAAYARSDNSSSFSSENSGIAGDVHAGPQLPPPAAAPPIFDPPPPNPFLSDIPLFTPNPSDLFYSPRHYYSYPNAVFSPPNVGTSFSPSVTDVMKALHEY